MEDAAEGISAETIDLLESRLRRIEYITYGHASRNTSSEATVTSRLKDLEIALKRTITASKTRQELLSLHARNPELFDTRSDATLISLESSANLSIVLAAASTYPLIASSLTSIHDTPIAPAETSINLICTRPQIAKLELLQAFQAKEIVELKQRSVSVLQRWYAVDILKSGEYWAAVEEIVEGVEQKVRRLAALKQRDEAAQ